MVVERHECFIRGISSIRNTRVVLVSCQDVRSSFRAEALSSSKTSWMPSGARSRREPHPNKKESGCQRGDSPANHPQVSTAIDVSVCSKTNSRPFDNT